jgi:3-deoxy-D-manno-octulosonic-acid transferase
MKNNVRGDSMHNAARGERGPRGERPARFAYALLLAALAPAYAARLWWRGRAEPLYRVAIGERFGRYADAPSSGWVWVHAVSLGETRAAAALVEALRARRPDMRLLLTHGTATGRGAGAALLRPGDRQTWLPYDAPPVVHRFLAHFRPAVGILMETEVWPNLVAAASARGVPLVLANARLSERSARRGERLAPLLRPAAERIGLVLAQTEDDAERARGAGAPEVRVSGNLKFDVSPDAAKVATGHAWHAALGRDVVLGAVTREGEEEMLLAAWQRHPAPRPLLAIVPRHPQRFDAVAAQVRAAGLTLARRSEWQDAPPPAARDADVWLGDSMGEMALWYGFAQVALLGGSWAPLGGQNLIEAAACGCPIVMGPHTFNFALAAELAEQAGAALRAPDLDAGVGAALGLLGTPRRDEMARAAVAFAAQHRGAAERMAEAIDGVLATRAG